MGHIYRTDILVCPYEISKTNFKKEEEGRFFGILDGGKGVIEAVLASIAISMFSAVLGTSTALADKEAALVSVVYMYSIILIIVAVLIMLFVNEDETSTKQTDDNGVKKESKNVGLKAIKNVLTNKSVLLLGVIIFMAYIVAWTIYYVGGFLQTNIGVTASAVGTITVIMLWMRPIGGILGGF